MKKEVIIMMDFRIVVAQDVETFGKMIKQNQDLGFKMINSNMCIRTPAPEVDNLGTGKVVDKSIREFYAYMERNNYYN